MIAAVCCGLGTAQAITTMSVTGAPTPNADDISQPNVFTGAGWSGINLAANNYPVGNTFITGSNAGGYTFDSLSINVLDPLNAAVGQTYRINIYTLTINQDPLPVYATSVFSATTTLGSVPVAGNYLTFTSTDAFQLSPDMAYAFTITGTSGSNMAFGYSNGNIYPAGSVIRVLGGTVGGDVEFGTSGFDMTFNLGLTAVPEPSSFGLAALGGVVLLRRRRA